MPRRELPGPRLGRHGQERPCNGLDTTDRTPLTQAPPRPLLCLEERHVEIKLLYSYEASPADLI